MPLVGTAVFVYGISAIISAAGGFAPLFSCEKCDRITKRSDCGEPEEMLVLAGAYSAGVGRRCGLFWRQRLRFFGRRAVWLCRDLCCLWGLDAVAKLLP